MTLGTLLTAAALSVERACYVWIARAPGRFRAWCAHPGVAPLGDPVAVVRTLFCGFKVVQLSIFAGWCGLFAHGGLALDEIDAWALVVGGALVLIGQTLNWSVFYRLGAIGVFYGDRLGYDILWCRAFPFSWLRHPQYVGTVLSIWGLFAALRFPRDDWALLPVLETAYYVVGTYLEERRTAPGDDGRAPCSPAITPVFRGIDDAPERAAQSRAGLSSTE